ncbi:GNAT family N-acetyltransferase [Liberiplasma polymorphum]|uniref:GNAT family N-acetyltransferase n=1 Tax=Liberiplasma polymorphum TaxID=3374570 RepID=UPI003770D12B
MKNVGTTPLETATLTLRKFTEDDALAMFTNYCSDEQTTKHLTWQTHKTVDVTESILKMWLYKYNEDYCYRWAIVEKSSQNLIGSIDCIRVDIEKSTCEIGYCIGSLYWGKGYMSEALKAVIDYLFKEAGFNRVMARYSMHNPASGRVMEKSGMVFEGITRESDLDKNGQFIDMGQYAILKKDYIK